MVILVDDEDGVEEEREQLPQDSRSASRLGSNYTAEALPWDEKRHDANPSGVSTSIWSDRAEPRGLDEIGRPKPRRPMFGQPSEMDDSGQHPFVTRPGPKIAGRAYSVTLKNDRRISVDDESRSSIGGADSRPPSQGSAFIPIQSTMRPRVKIAGRPSDAAFPIKMPGRRSGPERETGIDGVPTSRRNYKSSLSPYGILFED